MGPMYPYSYVKTAPAEMYIMSTNMNFRDLFQNN